MSTETFTGKMHQHNPIVLSVKNRIEAQRLGTLLELLEDRMENAPPMGMIMIALNERGGRVILCRGCLEMTRQYILETADLITDLLAYPSAEEEKAERTYGKRK